ncbi:NAD-dependent succinate-semialdehyde dehydrogenase [Photobacterium makurazakiensis]|uniref:NAD-dependent succinate-semialdehyde dehydrogenase n=1 Tax=Photobacterium makurazakiensis TaxID=2910234 RepID=UPI003D0BD535
MEIRSPELKQSGLFINGKWLESERQYRVLNPASRQTITFVHSAGFNQTVDAIESAEIAFKTWKKHTAKERATIVQRWGELMLTHKEALAELLTQEQGKPIAEARIEVEYAASFLEWFAEEAKRAYGDIIPSFKPNARVMVTKEPIGVVGAITPWNFPLAMITRKAGPAIAAGCTVVLKPSEETPLSANALAVLAEKAGIPAGVLNIVSGDAPEIGRALMESSSVRKISFTGSTAVGKLLARQASNTLKKLSLELGGNAPFIVFEDADIDQAVKGAINSKFRNTGQTCISVNRFYIHDDVYQEFTQKLAQAVSQLNVGNGLDESSKLGPLINEQSLAKSHQHVTDAISKGATVLTGGKPHSLGLNFYEPTVLSDATESMLIAVEETFGPVAACFRFSNEEDVLIRANDTNTGLAGYFYSRDYSRIWRVCEALEVGMVGINDGSISTESIPFGGVKESGLGREGSKYGIEDYLEIKYSLFGGLDYSPPL